MVTDVIVETPEAFRAWLTGEEAAADLPLDTAEGQRELFVSMGCGACHMLADAGSEGQVGPALDGIGDRADERISGMGARDYIQQSILEPNAHMVEGFSEGLMPGNFGEKLSDEQLTALVDYLLEQ
jgi:mono/diheme cytochrome c family protein